MAKSRHRFVQQGPCSETFDIRCSPIRSDRHWSHRDRFHRGPKRTRAQQIRTTSAASPHPGEHGGSRGCGGRRRTPRAGSLQHPGPRRLQPAAGRNAIGRRRERGIDLPGRLGRPGARRIGGVRVSALAGSPADPRFPGCDRGCSDWHAQAVAQLLFRRAPVGCRLSPDGSSGGQRNTGRSGLQHRTPPADRSAVGTSSAAAHDREYHRSARHRCGEHRRSRPSRAASIRRTHGDPHGWRSRYAGARRGGRPDAAGLGASTADQDRGRHYLAPARSAPGPRTDRQTCDRPRAVSVRHCSVTVALSALSRAVRQAARRKRRRNRARGGMHQRQGGSSLPGRLGLSNATRHRTGRSAGAGPADRRAGRAIPASQRRRPRTIAPCPEAGGDGDLGEWRRPRFRQCVTGARREREAHS